MARADYPEPVKGLIDELKRMPGVGPRSAERIALWLLQNPKAQPGALAGAIEQAASAVTSCPICGFFATVEGCPVCSDHSRDPGIMCVVEEATDVLPIERSGAFKGLYHCLGGKLSPLDNVTPDDLRIGLLVKRLAEMPGAEVVLAVGADVEGEATANYLAEILQGSDCSVTRLAQGLPAGGDLEHADALTVSRAFEGRRGLS
ncbi:MAG: recombination protein RecR [Akkermansiaceae bacterium]|nr:recombination protein RecR [Akkermansiaceae bacterium]NNM28672.1 recombination protein RecR [Akkermansiaceae bacterium]